MDKNYMLISIGDIWAIALKRRWLVLMPFLTCMVIGIILSSTLPKIYQAKTLILVEPQRVPSSYVRSLVDSDIETRINTISQQIMSRTSLEKIIQEFGLFKDPESKGLYIEDKLQILRNKIAVHVTRARAGTNAFSITFKDRSPDKVANVVNALATDFIDENLKVREAQAVGTSNFLDDELSNMRQKLEYLEEKLKNFREKFMGELPEQLQTNLRILDRLQEQQSQQQALLRETKTRLAALRRQPESGKEPIIVYQPGVNANIASDGRSLGDLKSQLNNLRGRYTEEHPDVIRLKKTIKELQEKQAAVITNAESSRTGSDVDVGNALSPETQMQIIEARRDAKAYETKIADLQKEIDFYKQRVEKTPKREQELLALNRDYTNIQESYSSLLSRKLEAEIAVNMERKQKGEQFRIIDSAKRPEKPIEPNLIKLFIIFLFAGLVFSGGIVFMIEYFGDRFWNSEEVEAYLGIPVIGTIPRIILPKDRMQKRLNDMSSIVVCMVTFFAFILFAAIALHGDEKVFGAFRAFRMITPFL